MCTTFWDSAFVLDLMPLLTKMKSGSCVDGNSDVNEEDEVEKGWVRWDFGRRGCIF